MANIYVVYCENCRTNEKLNEIAFVSEENAIDYINCKSREHQYIEWIYDYDVVRFQENDLITDNCIKSTGGNI